MAKALRKELILLYNMDSEKEKRIRFLCIKSGIRVRAVSAKQYLKPLGFLAGLKEFSDNNKIFEGEAFTDEMMVFAGFSSAFLDAFLAHMHKCKIPRIQLKAVLTPTNVYWDSVTLHNEIKQEHETLPH